MHQPNAISTISNASKLKDHLHSYLEVHVEPQHITLLFSSTFVCPLGFLPFYIDMAPRMHPFLCWCTQCQQKMLQPKCPHTSR